MLYLSPVPWMLILLTANCSRDARELVIAVLRWLPHCLVYIHELYSYKSIITCEMSNVFKNEKGATHTGVVLIHTEFIIVSTK